MPTTPHDPPSRASDPRPLPATCVLTKTVEQHISLPNSLLNLDELQRHSGPDLEGHREESVLPRGWGCQRKPPLPAGPHLSEPHGTLLGPHVAAPGDGLRQLCNIMLPVRLRLTLRQPRAPVRWTHRAQQGMPGSRDSSGVPWAVVSPALPPLRGQQLADVLQAAHVGELLLEELLHPLTCTHRNNFDATAGTEASKGAVRGHGVAPALPFH